MRVVTLGEILLRLSTYEDVRIKDTNNFRVCYGGAETNVGIFFRARKFSKRF